MKIYFTYEEIQNISEDKIKRLLIQLIPFQKSISNEEITFEGQGKEEAEAESIENNLILKLAIKPINLN